MRLFNSLQAVVIFVAWPFLIQWLGSAEIAGASVFYWTAIVAYFVGFCGVVFCVYNTVDKS